MAQEDVIPMQPCYIPGPSVDNAIMRINYHEQIYTIKINQYILTPHQGATNATNEVIYIEKERNSVIQ